MKRNLPARKERFCQEYCVDLNGTQAAIRAGYSERTAYSAGARLLKEPVVRARIDELLAEQAASIRLSAEWVLHRLRQESEREGDGASHSARVRALELLGKYLKMFVERAEVTGKDGAPIQVIEITKFKSAA